MQVVRTVLWVALALVVAGFVYLNWGEAQNVIIWPSEGNDSIVFDWPVGFIAFFFFLIGFVPMWLVHRGTKWRMNRRIKTLENAARAAAVSKPVAAPPVADQQSTSEDLTPSPEAKSWP